MDDYHCAKKATITGARATIKVLGHHQCVAGGYDLQIGHR